MTATGGEPPPLKQPPVDIVLRALRGRAGPDLALTGWSSLDSSNRSVAWRVQVIGAGDVMPAVVKQVSDVDGPFEAGHGETSSRFYDEWVALAVLSELGGEQPPGPRLLAVDERSGVLVMEDLGTESLADRLLSPAPLVHHDPCPDNVLVRAGNIRLIDFENARFGPLMVDASFLRISLPSCWCSGPLPRSLVDEAEQAYRRELGQVFAPVTDDGWFYQMLVDGCCYWVLKSLHWWPLAGLLDHDEDFDRASLRQRFLLRLAGLSEAYAALSRDHPVAETLLSLIGPLRDRWDSLPPIPSFPALIRSNP